MMTMLPVPSSGHIDTVIHISDTHIRTGDREHSRYDEYLNVFEKLIEKLSNLKTIKNGTAVVVITGDLFHSKCKVESSGLHLYTYITHKIADLCPLYIISGNHDMRQDAPEIPDMLSSFFSKESEKDGVFVDGNIALISRSGVYYVGDGENKIGFGHVHVRDTLKKGDGCGRVDVLPVFPVPNTPIKIALFHGTVCTPDSFNYNNSYPIEWFNEFNYGIFGDIHKQQINTHDKSNGEKLLWGYSGSLIQQNFGESLEGHGFLEWDIRKNTYKQHHIYNDIGYLKLKYESGIWYCFENGWEKIDVIYDNLKDIFPTKLKVRILSGIDSEGLIKLDQWCSNRDITYTKSNSLHILGSNIDEDDSEIKIESDFAQYNSSSVIHEFLEPLYSAEVVHNIINDPHKMCIIDDSKLPKSLINKVKKKNEDINVAIDKYVNAKDSESNYKKKKITLDYIKFQWILCFKDKCYFDFSKLSSQVGMISAPNGYGKSSFLEIICLALFGNTVGSRYNKTTSGAIFSSQCPNGVQPYTVIRFMLNGEVYDLFRSFRLQRYDKLKISKGVTELRSPSGEVIKSGSAVDPWVKTMIGDCNEFLLSCLISQNQDRDFLSMKSSEQLEILDNCLNLDVLKTITNLVKVSMQAHKWVLDHIDTAYTSLEYTNDESDDVNVGKDSNIETITTNKDIVYEKLENLEKKYKDIKNVYDSFSNVQMSDEELNELKNNDVDIETIRKKLDNLNKYNTEKHTLQELHVKRNVLVNDMNMQKELLDTNFNKEIKFDEESDDEIESITNESELSNFMYKYNDWNKQRIEYDAKVSEKKIKSLIEKLSKIKRPNVSEEEIEIENSNLEKEMKSIPEDVLKTTIEGHNANKTVKNCIQNVICDYESENEKLETRKDVLDNKISIECYELDVYKKENTIDKPDKDEDEIKKHIVFFTEGKEQYTKYERRIKRYKNFLDRAEELKSYVDVKKTELDTLGETLKTAHNHAKCLPFNPNCEACAKQPIRIQIQNLCEKFKILQEEYIELKNKYTEHVQNRDIKEIEDAYNEMIEWCENYKNIDIELYISYENKWKEYNLFASHCENKQKLIDSMKKECEELKYEQLDIFKEIQKNNKELNIITEQCNLEDIFLNNNSKWEDTKKRLSKLIKLWKRYNKYEKDIELVNGYNNVKEKTEYMNRLYKKLKLYIENKVKNIESDIETLDLHIEELNNIESCQHTLLLKEKEVKLNKKNSIYEEIKQLEEDILITKKECLKYDDLHKKATNQTLIRNKYEAYSNDIKEKAVILKELSVSFEKFRSWTYSNKILPQLVNSVNNISANMTKDDRKLTLSVSLEDKVLQWSVIDDQNTICIEKASGFQRFLLGLSIRISLSCIGASAISCSQLFIDEGFVACDVKNIKKVPAFIHSLLGMYDSLLLMSHLETIQESVETKIDIYRENGLSLLQFGSEKDVLTHKKSGRKKMYT